MPTAFEADDWRFFLEIGRGLTPFSSRLERPVTDALREANVLKNDDTSWLHQAFDYRNHGAHRTHIPRHIYLDGPMDGVVEFADLQSGGSTGVDVIDMFEGYHANMKDLPMRLRATVDRR